MKIVTMEQSVQPRQAEVLIDAIDGELLILRTDKGGVIYLDTKGTDLPATSENTFEKLQTFGSYRPFHGTITIVVP